MTDDREKFLRILVRDIADARELVVVREKRLRLAVENDGLTVRQVAELAHRATPGQPHRRARLQDLLRPDAAQDVGGGLTPEPGLRGATAEKPPSDHIGARVAPPSGVDEPAPCTCIRGIVNGHLPHFAECELASRIAHDAGPRHPSDDFEGAIE